MTSGASLTISNGNATIDLRNAIAEFGTSAKICSDDAPIYVMEIEDDGSLTGKVYSGEMSIANGVITIEDVKLDGKVATTNAAVMVDYYVDLPGKHVYEADITPDTFGGNYYVEADTLFRDQKTGKDMPANLTFPNVRLQSNFTMTFAGTGDPSTFDFTMDAFPDYTYFDRTKKVLAVLQVVDSIALGAENAAAQADDPVMYHDETPQHAEAAAHDSNLTEDELGKNITSITWKSGDQDSTDAAYLPNLRDAISFGNYITINTADGEKSISEYSPVYTMAGATTAVNASDYIEISPDGYIVGIKDTNGSPITVTATFPEANSGSGIARNLEVHVVTDGRANG